MTTGAKGGAGPMRSICAWCGRVRDDEANRWVAIEPPPADPGAFTHGICQDCSAAILREATDGDAGAR